jgi:hypothetical protein
MMGASLSLFGLRAGGVWVRAERGAGAGARGLGSERAISAMVLTR